MATERHANMTSAESGPDLTPKTESGRALLDAIENPMRPVPLNYASTVDAILAIEQEAASKAVAEVLDVDVLTTVLHPWLGTTDIERSRVHVRRIAAEYARLIASKGATEPKTGCNAGWHIVEPSPKCPVCGRARSDPKGATDGD